MTDSNFTIQDPSGKGFLEIRGRAIRVDEAGRVSLNDIWRAVDSPTDKSPYEWVRLPDTQKAIEALILKLRENTEFSRIKPNSDDVSVLYAKRGRDGGTWAHPNLALQYAGYLRHDLRAEIHEIFLRYKMADPTLTDELLERSSPKESEWLIRREIGRKKRVEFTDTLAAHGVKGIGFADCTNANYRGLLGQDAGGLRQERGLPAKANVRDHLTSDELVSVMMSEVMAKKRIEALDDQSNTECARSCFQSSRNLKRMLEEEEEEIRRERERRGMQ